MFTNEFIRTEKYHLSWQIYSSVKNCWKIKVALHNYSGVNNEIMLFPKRIVFSSVISMHKLTCINCLHKNFALLGLSTGLPINGPLAEYFPMYFSLWIFFHWGSGEIVCHGSANNNTLKIFETICYHQAKQSLAVYTCKEGNQLTHLSTPVSSYYFNIWLQLPIILMWDERFIRSCAADAANVFTCSTTDFFF